MKLADPIIAPTRQQQAVLDCEAPHIVVSAAAGSGKTKVLVDLYLKYVLDHGLSPDQILTITFTRKAAAEMKGRIVQRLQSAGLYEQAQVAETGPIQTIHGFCERFLRENAIEAGLDPTFEILDEQASTRAKDRAVKQALAEVDNEHALSLIGMLAGKRSGARAKAPNLLEASVLNLLSRARESGYTRIEFEQAYDDPAHVLANWRRRLASEAPGHPEIESLNGNFVASLGEVYKAAGLAKPFHLKANSSEGRELAAAERTCGLAAIVSEAWRLLDAFIEQEQALDFPELEIRAVRLLEASEAARGRTSHAYKALLIDETQDVNPMQYRLVERLGASKKLMVGDHRQSIFGFRHADSRLFTDQAAKASRLELSENHRSQPGVINFVNRLFSSIWSPDYRPMQRAGNDSHGLDGVEVWLQKERGVALVAHAIQEMVEGGTSKGDIAALVRFGRYGVELQERLTRLGVQSVVTGGTEKFYVRLEVKDVANILRALSDPSDDFSLLAALRGPFARLSLDSIALLALRPPVSSAIADFSAPVEDDGDSLERFCAWFFPLAQYADRLPAWEVLGEVLAKSSLLESLARRNGAEQQIANVRKVLALAVAQPELGPSEFAEQVWDIQQIEHREGDAPITDEGADVVRIMTIHKAKGLQFPIVVVPDLHNSIEGRSQDVEMDKEGMLVARFDGPNPYHSYLAQRRYALEREEEHRLLYVALTRAQQRLCMVAHPNTSKNCLAKVVATNLDLEQAKKDGLLVSELAEQSR